MKPGTLVAKKSRWEIDSKNLYLGVVLEPSKKTPEAWLVLWTIKGSYRLQEHLADALIDLNECHTSGDNT
jgi:hypothetical protein